MNLTILVKVLAMGLLVTNHVRILPDPLAAVHPVH